MELDSHVIVDELRRLAPELRVTGGCFAHWLPHPRAVALADRQRILKTTERNATGKYLTDLVASVGLPAVEPARLVSGARDWPAGYTGSVSHKGTMVLAAIVPANRMKSIGVDVERHAAEDLSAIGGLDAAEHPPEISAAKRPVSLFSVKEAACKALNPILGRRLDFPDISVSWLPPDLTCSRGVARAADIALDVRCSVAVPPWIVSVALWRR